VFAENARSGCRRVRLVGAGDGVRHINRLRAGRVLSANIQDGGRRIALVDTLFRAALNGLGVGRGVGVAKSDGAAYPARASLEFRAQLPLHFSYSGIVVHFRGVVPLHVAGVGTRDTEWPLNVAAFVAAGLRAAAERVAIVQRVGSGGAAVVAGDR
jgi:hypothetical protein